MSLREVSLWHSYLPATQRQGVCVRYNRDTNVYIAPHSIQRCKFTTRKVVCRSGCTGPNNSEDSKPLTCSTHWLENDNAPWTALLRLNKSPGYISEVLLYTSLFYVSICPPGLSAEAMYSPQQGSDTLKNIAGGGYILLVIFYFYRLFRKRAERATTVPLSSSKASDSEEEEVDQLAALDATTVTEEEDGPKDVSIVQCLIGVAQAGAFCYGFFLLSRVVDDYFAHQDVPSQYTARNITLVIQSVVRGLVYLVTFIFGANATGLAALAIQLVVDPEGVDRGLDQPREKKDILPRVKLTDDLGSIKRAFKEAENMGARDVKYKKK